MIGCCTAGAVSQLRHHWQAGRPPGGWWVKKTTKQGKARQARKGKEGRKEGTEGRKVQRAVGCKVSSDGSYNI
jgi:hypothetical protein